LVQLTTFIAAPQQRVFDLSLSMGVHKASMARYNETIVKGPGSGLLQLNEQVTWKAKHLFKERLLTVRLCESKPPFFFEDEQVHGAFKMMKHEHYFKPAENGTIMIDQFLYSLPYASVGKLLNKLYLEGYLKKLLMERNDFIKKAAEGNLWKQYL
jgi:hypothetical protein